LGVEVGVDRAQHGRGTFYRHRQEVFDGEEVAEVGFGVGDQRVTVLRGGQAQRGAVLPPSGKTRITIYLDDAILEAFRRRAEKEGKGYQTLINEALGAALGQSSAPVTVGTLRKVLREELKHAA
jgi:hypothetical protein